MCYEDEHVALNKQKIGKHVWSRSNWELGQGPVPMGNAG